MSLTSFEQLLPVLVMLAVVVVTRLLDYYFPRDRIRPGTESRTSSNSPASKEEEFLDQATRETLRKLLSDIDGGHLQSKEAQADPSPPATLDDETRAQLIELLKKLDITRE